MNHVVGYHSCQRSISYEGGDNRYLRDITLSCQRVDGCNCVKHRFLQNGRREVLRIGIRELHRKQHRQAGEVERRMKTFTLDR